MSEKHDLEQNDSLRDYYKEIGDGMEPPAHLVQAAKTGVFANPATKPSIHVWRFTKAITCYALGIALFLGTIALLPRLFEGFGPAGPQVTTTTALTDETDFVDHSEDLLKAEILKAYAGDRTDIDQISVRIIAQEGDLCAVWIDDPNAEYITVVPTPDRVFGLTFDYGGPQQILIYKRGIDFFNSIPAAAYYDKYLPKEFVREIYIAYYSASLKLKEKRYCHATVDEEYSENQIFIAVHSEFNEYPYTEQDFDFIGCTKVEEIAAVGDIGPNGEVSQYRLLLLTLNQSSKQNVLSAVKRLEAELDIHTAGPYGYGEWTPETPHPPITEPDPPVTPPVDDREYCVKQLEKGLGITLVTDRQLTEEEIDQVRAFISQKDANLALACTYVPFFTPYQISLYELMYASDIKEEFPDNPYQNDGSMMTIARIRAVVQKFFGIEVSASMWNALVQDGATHFPELDAYGFPRTDSSGFIPADPVYGYRLEDGRWMVHLCSYDAEGDHVIILLSPRHGSFRIDAGLQVHKWDLPAQPSDAP